MGKVERQKDGHILSSFMTNYKTQYYYWEYIIFIRRMCIAMFSVSATDNNYNVIFILILFIFLFYQNRFEPFLFTTDNVYYNRLVWDVTNDRISSCT